MDSPLYRAAVTIALAALLPHSGLAVTGDKAEFRRLAPDVYAFIGKRNDANALVVVTAQGVVLVDTGNNPPETRLLQGFIRSVTDQPVRYVVITQNHGDHVGGTPLFAPPANVIVHERVAKDWASWKPYQVKSWRKRFRERSGGTLRWVGRCAVNFSASQNIVLHPAHSYAPVNRERFYLPRRVRVDLAVGPHLVPGHFAFDVFRRITRSVDALSTSRASRSNLLVSGSLALAKVSSVDFVWI